MYRNISAVQAERKTYSMPVQLALEDANKTRADLLFLPHRVEDISSLKEHRKSGTDFLLHPIQDDGTYGAPIRCENKFEQKTSGNIVYEWISVDRGRFAPGWMVTSQAAWLLSWFPSGELFAAHMDELREVLLRNPARHKSTTTKNQRYLTWNTLERLSYMAATLETARIVDVSRELGETPTEAPMLGTASRKALVDAEGLVSHMENYPRASTPLVLGEPQLVEIAKKLAPLDLMRKYNAPMLNALPWLN